MNTSQEKIRNKMKCLFTIVVSVSSLGCTPGASHLEGYVEANGVNLYYETYGSGEPVFVVHGGPGMFHDYLEPHFRSLADSNMLVFYDQRGNGRSTLERIDRDTFNVELMIEDLESLRKEFNVDQISLVGHSWGGLLALYYAAKNPNNVRRLILIDAAPVNTELLVKSYENMVSRFTESEWAQLGALYESKEYKNGDPVVHNQAMRLFEGKNFYRKGLIDEFMVYASFDERTARNMTKIGPLGTNMLLNVSVEERLDQITCPVLIIHSRQDFIVEESPRLTHKRLVNSRIEYIEESGHYPFIEAPEVLFDLVRRFLEET
jgi:proline iminopeptidase